jgi:hypothetical protein
MTKTEIYRLYRGASAEDRRTFDRWLAANVVIASTFAAGLFAMVLSGSGSLELRQAAAGVTAGPASARLVQQSPQERIQSAFELMVRIAPDQLPVQQVDQPF